MTAFITVNGAAIDVKSALQWQLILGNTTLINETVQMDGRKQHRP